MSPCMSQNAYFVVHLRIPWGKPWDTPETAASRKEDLHDTDDEDNIAHMCYILTSVLFATERVGPEVFVGSA